MQMGYSEILLNSKPWANGAVLVGLVAEDPKSGRVKIVRAGISDGDPREIGAVDRFLASLEALAKLTNSGKGCCSVGAILKQVPDRGTSFQFSTPRSGEFNSVAAALKHCRSKKAVNPVSRPPLVNPAGRPATA